MKETVTRNHLVISSLFVAIFLMPMETVSADTIWQALFFDEYILSRSWWVIPLGLLIEFPAVRKMTMFSWPKSGIVTIVMNVVSFLLGIFLQIPTLFISRLQDTVAISAIAIFGNTFIEGVVINRFCKNAFNRRTFGLLLLVNAVSVSITLVVLEMNLHRWMRSL